MTHRDIGYRDYRDMGPFTAKGRKLLELLAAVGQLVAGQSSSVDAWVTDPTNGGSEHRVDCEEARKRF